MALIIILIAEVIALGNYLVKNRLRSHFSDVLSGLGLIIAMIGIVSSIVWFHQDLAIFVALLSILNLFGYFLIQVKRN
jgi:hypothetical protein